MSEVKAHLHTISTGCSYKEDCGEAIPISCIDLEKANALGEIIGQGGEVQDISNMFTGRWRQPHDATIFNPFKVNFARIPDRAKFLIAEFQNNSTIWWGKTNELKAIGVETHQNLRTIPELVHAAHYYIGELQPNEAIYTDSPMLLSTLLIVIGKLRAHIAMKAVRTSSRNAFTFSKLQQKRLRAIEDMIINGGRRTVWMAETQQLLEEGVHKGTFDKEPEDWTYDESNMGPVLPKTEKEIMEAIMKATKVKPSLLESAAHFPVNPSEEAWDEKPRRERLARLTKIVEEARQLDYEHAKGRTSLRDVMILEDDRRFYPDRLVASGQLLFATTGDKGESLDLFLRLFNAEKEMRTNMEEVVARWTVDKVGTIKAKHPRRPVGTHVDDLAWAARNIFDALLTKTLIMEMLRKENLALGLRKEELLRKTMAGVGHTITASVGVTWGVKLKKKLLDAFDPIPKQHQLSQLVGISGYMSKNYPYPKYCELCRPLRAAEKLPGVEYDMLIRTEQFRVDLANLRECYTDRPFAPMPIAEIEAGLRVFIAMVDGSGGGAGYVEISLSVSLLESEFKRISALRREGIPADIDYEKLRADIQIHDCDSAVWDPTMKPLAPLECETLAMDYYRQHGHWNLVPTIVVGDHRNLVNIGYKHCKAVTLEARFKKFISVRDWLISTPTVMPTWMAGYMNWADVFSRLSSAQRIAAYWFGKSRGWNYYSTLKELFPKARSYPIGEEEIKKYDSHKQKVARQKSKGYAHPTDVSGQQNPLNELETETGKPVLWTTTTWPDQDDEAYLKEDQEAFEKDYEALIGRNEPRTEAERAESQKIGDGEVHPMVMLTHTFKGPEEFQELLDKGESVYGPAACRWDLNQEFEGAKKHFDIVRDTCRADEPEIFEVRSFDTYDGELFQNGCELYEHRMLETAPTDERHTFYDNREGTCVIGADAVYRNVIARVGTPWLRCVLNMEFRIWNHSEFRVVEVRYDFKRNRAVGAQEANSIYRFVEFNPQKNGEFTIPEELKAIFPGREVTRDMSPLEEGIRRFDMFNFYQRERDEGRMLDPEFPVDGIEGKEFTEKEKEEAEAARRLMGVRTDLLLGRTRRDTSKLLPFDGSGTVAFDYARLHRGLKRFSISEDQYLFCHQNGGCLRQDEMETVFECSEVQPEGTLESRKQKIKTCPNCTGLAHKQRPLKMVSLEKDRSETTCELDTMFINLKHFEALNKRGRPTHTVEWPQDVVMGQDDSEKIWNDETAAKTKRENRTVWALRVLVTGDNRVTIEDLNTDDPRDPIGQIQHAEELFWDNTKHFEIIRSSDLAIAGKLKQSDHFAGRTMPALPRECNNSLPKIGPMQYWIRTMLYDYRTANLTHKLSRKAQLDLIRRRMNSLANQKIYIDGCPGEMLYKNIKDKVIQGVIGYEHLRVASNRKIQLLLKHRMWYHNTPIPRHECRNCIVPFVHSRGKVMLGELTGFTQDLTNAMSANGLLYKVPSARMLWPRAQRPTGSFIEMYDYTHERTIRYATGCWQAYSTDYVRDDFRISSIQAATTAAIQKGYTWKTRVSRNQDLSLVTLNRAWSDVMVLRRHVMGPWFVMHAPDNTEFVGIPFDYWRLNRKGIYWVWREKDPLNKKKLGPHRAAIWLCMKDKEDYEYKQLTQGWRMVTGKGTDPAYDVFRDMLEKQIRDKTRVATGLRTGAGTMVGTGSVPEEDPILPYRPRRPDAQAKKDMANFELPPDQHAPPMASHNFADENYPKDMNAVPPFQPTGVYDQEWDEEPDPRDHEPENYTDWETPKALLERYQMSQKLRPPQEEDEDSDSGDSDEDVDHELLTDSGEETPPPRTPDKPMKPGPATGLGPKPNKPMKLSPLEMIYLTSGLGGSPSGKETVPKLGPANRAMKQPWKAKRGPGRPRKCSAVVPSGWETDETFGSDRDTMDSVQLEQEMNGKGPSLRADIAELGNPDRKRQRDETQAETAASSSSPKRSNFPEPKLHNTETAKATLDDTLEGEELFETPYDKEAAAKEWYAAGINWANHVLVAYENLRTCHLRVDSVGYNEDGLWLVRTIDSAQEGPEVRRGRYIQIPFPKGKEYQEADFTVKAAQRLTPQELPPMDESGRYPFLKKSRYLVEGIDMEAKAATDVLIDLLMSGRTEKASFLMATVDGEWEKAPHWIRPNKEEKDEARCVQVELDDTAETFQDKCYRARMFAHNQQGISNNYEVDGISNHIVTLNPEELMEVAREHPEAFREVIAKRKASEGKPGAKPECLLTQGPEPQCMISMTGFTHPVTIQDCPQEFLHDLRRRTPTVSMLRKLMEKFHFFGKGLPAKNCWWKCATRVLDRDGNYVGMSDLMVDSQCRAGPMHKPLNIEHGRQHRFHMTMGIAGFKQYLRAGGILYNIEVPNWEIWSHEVGGFGCLAADRKPMAAIVQPQIMSIDGQIHTMAPQLAYIMTSYSGGLIFGPDEIERMRISEVKNEKEESLLKFDRFPTSDGRVIEVKTHTVVPIGIHEAADCTIGRRDCEVALVETTAEKAKERRKQLKQQEDSKKPALCEVASQMFATQSGDQHERIAQELNAQVEIQTKTKVVVSDTDRGTPVRSHAVPVRWNEGDKMLEVYVISKEASPETPTRFETIQELVTEEDKNPLNTARRAWQTATVLGAGAKKIGRTLTGVLYRAFSYNHHRKEQMVHLIPCERKYEVKLNQGAGVWIPAALLLEQWQNDETLELPERATREIRMRMHLDKFCHGDSAARDAALNKRNMTSTTKQAVEPGKAKKKKRNMIAQDDTLFVEVPCAFRAGTVVSVYVRDQKRWDSTVGWQVKNEGVVDTRLGLWVVTPAQRVPVLLKSKLNQRIPEHVEMIIKSHNDVYEDAHRFEVLVQQSKEYDAIKPSLKCTNTTEPEDELGRLTELDSEEEIYARYKTERAEQHKLRVTKQQKEREAKKEEVRKLTPVALKWRDVSDHPKQAKKQVTVEEGLWRRPRDWHSRPLTQWKDAERIINTTRGYEVWLTKDQDEGQRDFQYDHIYYEKNITSAKTLQKFFQEMEAHLFANATVLLVGSADGIAALTLLMHTRTIEHYHEDIVFEEGNWVREAVRWFDEYGRKFVWKENPKVRPSFEEDRWLTAARPREDPYLGTSAYKREETTKSGRSLGAGSWDEINMEQEKWMKQNESGQDRNDPVWIWQICESLLSGCHTDDFKQEVEDLKAAGHSDIDVDDIYDIIERYVYALALVYREHWFAEGQTIPAAVNGELGMEVLNPARRPTKLPNPPMRGEDEVRLIDLLMKRDCLIKLAKTYEQQTDGALFWVSAIMTAARAGKASGRTVYALQMLNKMSYTPFTVRLHTNNFIGKISRSDARYLCGSDIAKAFQSLSYSPCLRRYFGLDNSGRLYIALRGTLGFRPLPAYFTLLVAGAMEQIVTSNEASDAFRTEVMDAVMADRAKGIGNPIKGMLRRCSDDLGLGPEAAEKSPVTKEQKVDTPTQTSPTEANQKESEDTPCNGVSEAPPRELNMSHGRDEDAGASDAATIGGDTERDDFTDAGSEISGAETADEDTGSEAAEPEADEKETVVQNPANGDNRPEEPTPDDGPGEPECEVQ